MLHFQMKRIYEPRSPEDGFRVLADRLWPRGIKKEAAGLDFWAKDLAPSADLRKLYHGGHIGWPEFRRLYREELLGGPALDAFRRLTADKDRVTLLFAGKDSGQTHVDVLIEVLGQ